MSSNDTSNRAPAEADRLHPTLERTVMVGYQGWFRAEGDGSKLGWNHYADPKGDFMPDHLTIDYWPASEYPIQHQTEFFLPDGTPARVMSSYDESTVDLHFKWMKEYGIDGAYVQRFAGPIVRSPDGSEVYKTILAATNEVLRHALVAAVAHGRSVAVMYDLSGLRAGAMDDVIADWKSLVDEVAATGSPAYQHHRGKPVVGVWGVGFNDARAYTLEETARLLKFLRDDPRYGGNCIVAGVATGWRTAGDWRSAQQDATNEKGLQDVLKLASIISAWTPGRFSDLGLARLHFEQNWQPDLAWCTARGIEYLPVVFPGFSWTNLQNGLVAAGAKAQGRKFIDRVEGRFLWEQYHLLVNGGCTMIYQAMFDEMDEGTQIFKVADVVPPGQNLLTYPSPLPTDYYLRLVRFAAGFLRTQTRPFPPDIPKFEDLPAVNELLQNTNAAVHQHAENSYQTNRARLHYATVIAAWLPDWAPVDELGTRVLLGGKWEARPAWSADEDATVTWELPVKETAGFRLMIRNPGDANQQNSPILLTLAAGQNEVLRRTIDVQVDTEQWNEVGRVTLAAGAPVRCLVKRAPEVAPLAPPRPRLAFCEVRLEKF